MMTLEQIKRKTGLTTEEIASLLVIYSQKYLSWLGVKNAHNGAIVADLTTHRAVMERINDLP